MKTRNFLELALRVAEKYPNHRGISSGQVMLAAMADLPLWDDTVVGYSVGTTTLLTGDGTIWPENTLALKKGFSTVAVLYKDNYGRFVEHLEETAS